MRRFAAFFLVLASCNGQDEHTRKLWGGLESTLESPSKVEAYRIEGGLSSSPQPTQPNFDYTTWRVTAGPVVVDASSSKGLATLLLDAKSYYHGPPKACLPTPGVKLAFTSASRTIWVYLCFECRMLMVYDGSTPRGGADFDPAAPALGALMKPLFPKDPVIQALK